MENGYLIDKYLIPKVKILCPSHLNEQACSVCTEPLCVKPAIMCSTCKKDDDDHQKDHKNYIKTIDKYITQATSDIENHAKGNKTLFNEVFQNQENQSLQKWYQEGEIHLKQVDNHISAQKLLIEEDFQNSINALQGMLKNIKQNMYQKLDDFLQNYRSSFNNFKEMLEENFQLQKNFQYYNNCNVLVSKLHSETPFNANDFVLQLKKAVEKAKNMNSNRTAFLNSIKKMSQNLNKMTDNLPNYMQTDNFSGLTKQITNDVELFFTQNLTILDLKDLAVTKDFLDKKSAYTYSILNDNKNLLMQSMHKDSEDMQLKPVKKFQLDIPITSMTALSDIHLALASSQDSKLRIFESQQKRIHTIQAHKEPVTFLTKLITEERFMVNNISSTESGTNKQNISTNKIELQNVKKQFQKKVLLVSCSMDNSIILWNFDYEMKQTPNVYQKLLGFSETPSYVIDLQDNQCIVSGDFSGEINVWDYHKPKIIFACKGKHNGKIVGMNLIKKYDKFIVGSEDNTISIWRMKYNQQFGVPPYAESFYVEQVITDSSFGGITAMAISVKESPLVFLGNQIGTLKLYNYEKQKLIAEINAHNNVPVLDLSLIEGFGKDSFNMNLLSLGLGDKYLRMWKVQKKDNQEEVVCNGLKLDVSIHNNDTNSKSKLQILKGFSPKFIIANEKNKELLVYEITC